MAVELAELANIVGRSDAPGLGAQEPDQPFELSQIYDGEIEKLAPDAYQRDYVTFGFSRWA